MLLSEYVAMFFAQQGVKHAFGVTGGASIHLLHAFENNPDTVPVCMHHEQSAAMSADGYARLTGHVGVAFGTSGPGAMNLITGIAGAWFDSVPSVYLTGQVTTFRAKGTSGVRQFGFQETDILPMVQPITKYCCQIRDASDIRKELEKAIHIATSGRPGPVLIDIPDDLQRTEIDVEKLAGYVPETPASPDEPEAGKLAELSGLLAKAKRPVLIFGWGVQLSGARNKALDLAEKWQIPVLTTWAAKDIMPAEHPLCVGTFGTHGTRAGNFTVQNSDLVISVGSRLSTRETGSPLTSWARAADLVVVDIDENELGKFETFGKPLRLGICADAAATISGLLEFDVTPHHDWTDWLERIDGWKRNYAPSRGNVAGGIDPYDFMSQLSRHLPSTANIFSDTGCTVAWLMQAFAGKPEQRILHDFNNTAMGWGLPAAIGGALAFPSTPTVCLVGDGSLMMNVQELSTLSLHNLPVKVFLLDNDGYSMVKQTEEQWLRGKNVGTSVTSGLSFPDFRELAGAFKLPFLSVTEPDGLPAFFEEAMQINGPAFLHVRIPPEARVVPQVKYGYPIEDAEPLLPRPEFLSNMLVDPMPKSLEPIDPAAANETGV